MMLGSSYLPRHAVPRRERSRLRAAAAGVAATLMLGGLALAIELPAASAEEACTKKCYSAVVSPQSSPASSSQSFSVVLTNLRAQRLGSADITPPAGYSVTSMPTTTRGTVMLVGGVIQLRNADLPEGSSLTVSFTGKTPAVAGTYAWTVVAKQANEFNDAAGTGNLLVQDQSATDLTTVVTAPTTTTTCPPGTVSCATSTIDYNQVSTVNTCPDGLGTNSTRWLCGKITFPATGTDGNQSYKMEAYENPGNYCPLGAETVQCTYELYIDPVPTFYANFPATLVIECDVTKCVGEQLTVTKLDEKGTTDPEDDTTTPILPCVPVSTDMCWTQSRQVDGDLEITFANVGPGDPKIAGFTV